ncbi:hypothetical protein [Nocardia sp. NPDC005366]|uniref:hypothetical protein n=1 Tax=Nocardia sp. NPDC005366 TaxID=3156878 RepID=UPI0033A69CBF
MTEPRQPRPGPHSRMPHYPPPKKRRAAWPWVLLFGVCACALLLFGGCAALLGNVSGRVAGSAEQRSAVEFHGSAFSGGVRVAVK